MSFSARYLPAVLFTLFSLWTTLPAQSTNTPAAETKLRQPEAATARTKLRKTAEAKRTELDLKPCQNLTGFELKS
jgi:hypothetical protein